MIWLKIKCSISAQKEQKELRMIRPQHRPLRAVTKREAPGSSPRGWRAGLHPRLCPSSGGEHQDAQCVRGMAALAGGQGCGARGFPSTGIAQGRGKDRIMWFCDLLLTQWNFICGKLEGLIWGGVGSESRTPYTGAPPEASFPCSLLKGFQVAQPGKTGRVPATRKAQNKLWRHSDSFSADLTGPWVPGAWWGNGEQGKGSGEETVP